MSNKELLKRVNFFYMLSFIFSGIMYGISIFICKKLNINDIETILITIMSAQLAPTIATIICKKRYKDNSKIFIKPKINLKWIFIIIIPFISVYAQYFLLEKLNQSFKHSLFFDNTLIIILTIITTIIGSIGEEIGWRGYLYNLLGSKLSPFINSIVIGILWGVWHFTKIFNLGFIYYILFIINCIPISILMCYINNKLNKSIVPSIIFHTILNLSFMYLLYERETTYGYIISIFVLTIVIVILRIIDSKYFKSQHNKSNIK